MNYKLLLCFLFLPTFLLSAQNLEELPGYPSYKTVVTEFLRKYQDPKLTYPRELTFAKKPDGWHVLVVENRRESKIITDELFWVRIADTYLELNFAKNDKDLPSVEIPERLNQWNYNYFTKILPFWGYVGWDKDVIAEYENKNNLSDSTLHALARAYASYAANLLNNNSGFSDPSTRFKLNTNHLPLTYEQLGEYRKYQHLSIETYEKLWKLNPTFENFIANVYTVYSNEVMNSFLTLKYYKSNDEAVKELKPGLYDPFLISMARNYLASCDSNAILLTNGDNDTFPLLYVQETKGFRQDVLVVNISLLSSPRYIDHLFDKVGKAAPLPVCLDKEIYKNGLKEIVYIIKNDSVTGYTDLPTLLQNVASNDKALKYESGGMYFDYFPTSQVKLAVAKEKVLLANMVSLSDRDSIVAEMQWNLGADKEYLTSNELAIIDMLSCAGFNRPIYFAITVEEGSFLGLQKYFQAQGLAYKVVPVLANSGAGFTGRVNTTEQYDVLMKKFTFDNQLSKPTLYSSTHSRLATNYRIQYAQLAHALIDKKVDNYALKVLDYCSEKLPSKEFPHNYFGIKMADAYYRLAESKKANAIVKEMADNYSSEIHKLFEKGLADNYEYKLALYIMAELSRLTNETYPQGKFGKAIRGQFVEAQRKRFIVN